MASPGAACAVVPPVRGGSAKRPAPGTARAAVMPARRGGPALAAPALAAPALAAPALAAPALAAPALAAPALAALVAALALGACSGFQSQLQLRVPPTPALQQSLDRGALGFVSQRASSWAVVLPGSWADGAADLAIEVGVQNLTGDDVEVSEADIQVLVDGRPVPVLTQRAWQDRQGAAAFADVVGGLSSVLYGDAVLSEAAMRHLYKNRVGRHAVSVYWGVSGSRARTATLLALEQAALDDVEQAGQGYFQHRSVAPREWYFGHVRLRRLRGFAAGAQVDIQVRVGGDVHSFPLTTQAGPEA